MPMYSTETVVGTADGKKWPAKWFACECGCDRFHIFWVDGQTHCHYQCVDCSQSFCGTWDNTPCVKPPPMGSA